ncbi:MAG: DUF2160 family membrane protein, partial [Pseudomonadota bacterium]
SSSTSVSRFPAFRFLTLLGSAYIFLAWLGIVGQPIWTPLFIAVAWGVFVFWKV